MSFLNSMRTPFAAALLALATVAAAPTTALAQASAPADATTAPAAPAAPAASSDASATPAPAAVDTGAAPIAPAAVGKETIENPYGLGALWRDGGWIAKFNLVIMLIMSMGSWYIIFTKYWEQRKMFQAAKACPTASGRRARSRPAPTRWKKARPSATSPNPA